MSTRFPPPFQGSFQGDGVGILEIAAHGDTLGNSADSNTPVPKQSGEVGGRCLTFGAGVEGEDHLVDRIPVQPAQELLDSEVVRPDTVEGSQDSLQDVVAAAEGAGLLEGEEISHLLHDAEATHISAGIAADEAGIFVGEIEARGAEADLALDLQDAGSKGFGQLSRGTEEKEGQAGGRLLTDPGELGELGDESRQRRGVGGHDKVS